MASNLDVNLTGPRYWYIWYADIFLLSLIFIFVLYGKVTTAISTETQHNIVYVTVILDLKNNIILYVISVSTTMKILCILLIIIAVWTIQTMPGSATLSHELVADIALLFFPKDVLNLVPITGDTECEPCLIPVSESHHNSTNLYH